MHSPGWTKRGGLEKGCRMLYYHHHRYSITCLIHAQAIYTGSSTVKGRTEGPWTLVSICLETSLILCLNIKTTLYAFLMLKEHAFDPQNFSLSIFPFSHSIFDRKQVLLFIVFICFFFPSFSRFWFTHCILFCVFSLVNCNAIIPTKRKAKIEPKSWFSCFERR